MIIIFISPNGELGPIFTDRGSINHANIFDFRGYGYDVYHRQAVKLERLMRRVDKVQRVTPNVDTCSERAEWIAR